ncbi:MAG: glycoside hydrolase family 9 protein [Lachnospiraceae bacterium]|nr:glycoside hydrolase family 9 protein [Lachnospiraceae bacterium]
MKFWNQYKKFRYHILCCVILAVILVAGACGRQEKTQQSEAHQGSGTETADTAQQAGSAQQESYGSVLASYGVVLPVSRPSIYVDAAGYVSGREKKVIFAGDRHGQTFDVVRSRDGEVVYTGRIPRGEVDQLSGQVLSVGDFSDFDEPGTYYIHTDIAGQSYPFGIAEDTYENLFLSMLKNISNAEMQESPEGVCDVSFGMHAAMYALQCNGSLFEAAYQHLDKSEQDKQLVTQLLYMGKWLSSRQKENGSLYDDYEATAAFCGIMAMSRDMFGRYEANVGREYQNAADVAWAWLEQHPCETDSERSAQFYAAAQLFKADGGETYKAIAERFLREKKEDYSGERFVFYGVLAYISAEKGTDRDLCTYIMRDMVDRVEAICEEVKQDSVFGTGTRTAGENMSNMLHLSFVNYLTPSKEYTVIIENTIQYMGGLNEHGICYMGADGTQMPGFEWKGIILLGMSDMISNINELENKAFSGMEISEGY